MINQNVCLELSVTALRLYSVCSKQNTPKGGFPTINKIEVKEAWKILQNGQFSYLEKKEESSQTTFDEKTVSNGHFQVAFICNN